MYSKMRYLKCWQFYLLSFTWGLPMSLAGLLVCGALMCVGYKPKRYGHCYHIQIGKTWGGVNLGWLFIANRNCTEFVKQHELGHGYQNACMLGPLFPIYGLVSATRYWLKRFGVNISYYNWWFEGHASKIGEEVMR